ncbi:hypothetical protein [Streptomyces monomycini]|uniref:hypothetical protein n=1 Tax=Streptomyces monomycini TaxID=371720 RepID=UPI0004AAA9DE|nr:hypothetical protein [Streptomyces monomycini]
MKRLRAAVGISCAAAALCLTCPTSAQAATGTLTVNGGEKFVNPHDGACFSWPKAGLDIKNQTNREVVVYRGTNCSGTVGQVVPPGKSAKAPRGISVKIQR